MYLAQVDGGCPCSPNRVCMCGGVFAVKLEASEYEDLGQGWGISQAKGLCLYPEEPVRMGCLWDKGVSAACLLLSTDLDETANRGPTRWVRGPGSGQGY